MALASLCAGTAAAALAADPVNPDPAPRASVGAVVAGIVSYTRWPGEAASIRLCTVGRGPGVDELLHTELGSMQRPVAVRALAAVGQARGECEAVYVAGVASGTGRDVMKLLAGQPVLLLGEGAEFCSDGGMFCLEPGASTVRFNANLDAIARSGLRVNPLVLRIARGAPGGGS
jgi:hypothetical protein